MRVDLHIHTQASDGTWTPAQAVEHVRAIGIGLFAITDHDSIDNVAAVESLVRGTGLRFLRGVEVSTSLNGSLYHVTAYGFDPTNQALQALVSSNRQRLEDANRESLDRLRRDGFSIDLDVYDTYENDPTRGGWASLNYLIDQGLCTGVGDYWQLFNEDRPTPFPTFPPPAEVVSIIADAGGVPILAHPGASWLPTSGEDLETFRRAGIRGLECYATHHDEAKTRGFVAWCRRHDLLVTGGSDCHGEFIPSRKLGLPYVELADLRLDELQDSIIM